MLNIVNNEHYDAVVAQAAQLGLMPELQAQLDYLAGYACHDAPDHTRCDLHYDFAPLSFAFTMHVLDDAGKYKRWFIGGLIFHPGATGTDRSLSVELCPQRQPHWSVHT